MSNALEQASLIMIPSGYEDGRLGSLKPLDGSGDFTFTRCDGAAQCDLAATRVNADGNIEKGYENLLFPSNDFSGWSKVELDLTPNQADPFGGNTASLITTTGTTFGWIRRNPTTTGVQTISFYAKAGSNTILTTSVINAPYPQIKFTLTGNGSTSSNSVPIDSTITSVGDGWYRCSMTFNLTSAYEIRFYPNDTINETIGDSAYIYGFQLNQGMVAYPYVETTTAPVAAGILEDMPRLDYSNGSCPSLLLEPSRTNLITHSEYIEGGDYSSTASFAYNTHISPEGVQNALTLTDNSTSGIEQVEYRPAHTAGTSYVFSMFVKKDSDTTRFPEIFFRIGGGITQEITTQINTSTGAKIDSILNGDVSSEVIDFSDDYWRVIIKAGDEVSDGNTFIRLRIRPAAGDVFGVQNPTTTGSIVTYGWQLEQDATYPTSYIPTYGVSQTRLADDVSPLAGLDALNNEATIMAEFKVDSTGSGYFIQSTGANSYVNISQHTQERLRMIVRFEGVNQAIVIVANRIYPDTDYKLALRYDTNKADVFLNGENIISRTGTWTLEPLDNLVLNFTEGNETKQLLVFPTALSDEACIELTTIS
jgi:hypothetical protein